MLQSRSLPRFSARWCAPPFQSSDGRRYDRKSQRWRFASGVFASIASVRPSSASSVEWALFVFYLWKVQMLELEHSGLRNQKMEPVDRRHRQEGSRRDQEGCDEAKSFLAWAHVAVTCVASASSRLVNHSCIELIVNRVIRNGIVQQRHPSLFFFCCLHLQPLQHPRE